MIKQPIHSTSSGSENEAFERMRIQAILTHPATTGRLSLARHLAIETDMMPQAVVSCLAKAEISQDAVLPPKEMDSAIEEALERRLCRTTLDTPSGEPLSEHQQMISLIALRERRFLATLFDLAREQGSLERFHAVVCLDLPQVLKLRFVEMAPGSARGNFCPGELQ